MPCLACQKDGISTCTKRWGTFKQSGKGAKMKTREIETMEDIAETFVFDPSRPPPTSIDSVLTDGEVHLLQLCYRKRPRGTFNQLLDQILENVRFFYGPSVSCTSIRSSILASACVGEVSTSKDWEQRLEYHTMCARRALIRKDESSFGVDE